MEDDKTTAEQVAVDDAFTGGFEGKAAEVKPEVQTQATETPPADEKKDEPKYVQITETEWNRVKAAADKTDAHDRQFSTVFGTVGRFEQLVKQVRDAQSEVTGKLSSVAFDKLKEQFPELAEMTREAVQNALAARPVETDTSAFDRLRQERIAGEMEALEDAHPGWQQIVNVAAPGEEDPKHPFRVWLATKDEKYQARIIKTESASVISRAIDLYQRETSKPAVPPKATPARADVRREQIAAAVNPRGDGASPPPRATVDEAFEAGYRTG